jgi:hypothetical protein
MNSSMTFAALALTLAVLMATTAEGVPHTRRPVMQHAARPVMQHAARPARTARTKFIQQLKAHPLVRKIALKMQTTPAGFLHKLSQSRVARRIAQHHLSTGDSPSVFVQHMVRHPAVRSIVHRMIHQHIAHKNFLRKKFALRKKAMGARKMNLMQTKSKYGMNRFNNYMRPQPMNRFNKPMARPMGMNNMARPMPGAMVGQSPDMNHNMMARPAYPIRPGNMMQTNPGMPMNNMARPPMNNMARPPINNMNGAFMQTAPMQTTKKAFKQGPHMPAKPRWAY